VTTTKTAIVTGASRGIGRAIALRLARDGARVILCARDSAALEKAVSEIERYGGVAAAVSLDLRLPGTPAQLVDAALNAFGSIDTVVNNAGATKRGEFEDLTDEEWMDGFALKFFGSVRLTRAAWPHLRKRSGSVVNIAGVGGRTPGPQFTIGGSVNAALLSFTKALADLGVRDGIQVNAINPGAVRTDRLLKRLTADAADKGIDLTSATEELIRASNVTRLGEPEDIANLVSFIVGPEGRFLQGSLIDMDGGQTKTL
jgi:NAD(P)-dependent dehydrogenase (short-subunit alcohol dehydrogenase family)